MARVVMFVYVLFAGLATPSLLFAADGGESTPPPPATGAQATDPTGTTTAAPTPAAAPAAPPAPAPGPAPSAAPAAPAAQASPAGAAPAARAHPGRTSALVTRQPVKVRAVARAAGSDTISDYKYTPSTITVTAGESVTWNNSGPTGHSATADDGSFDTGILSKGASGSHTFSKAGTYSFHCTPHPFMKGTVVVTAASSGGGGGGGGSASGSASGTGSSSGSSSGTGSSSSGSGTSSSGSSGSSLPNTGADIGAVALLGTILVGGGMVLRRRAAGNR